MSGRTFEFVSGAIDAAFQRLSAIVSLLEPLQGECFELTCAGLLGSTEGSQEQKDAAKAWMERNYDRVSAAAFAAILLATDSKNDLEAVSLRLYSARKKALERAKGGTNA